MREFKLALEVVQHSVHALGEEEALCLGQLPSYLRVEAREECYYFHSGNYRYGLSSK